MKDTGMERMTARVYKKLEENFIKEGIKPSKFFYKDAFKEIVDTFFTDELKEYFLYIIDKYTEFQYQNGYSRRSLRSKNYGVYFHNIINSLCDFIDFGVFSSQKVSFKNYITNNMSEELIGYKLDKSYITISSILAAAIDKKDKDIFCKNASKHIETYRRSINIAYLLNNPKTKVERETVISLVADKAEQPRKEANKIASSMDLTEEEYSIISGMLKYIRKRYKNKCYKYFI